MSGSKINPKTYKGEIKDGGYLARNTGAKSSRSPHWKGTYYMSGYGWIWVSAWEVREGMFRLSLQDMTDEQARKYCQPKGDYKAPPAPASNGAERPESGQSDIPF